MMQLRFNWAYLIASLLLAGCGAFSSRPDPSRFFTLSSLRESKEVLDWSGTTELILVGIGPVKFPGYLDREEIVTRSAENRFDVSENDRWAEPLDENFARMLSENLTVVLRVARVIQYPWQSSKKPKYQVEIEVIRCEVNSAGDAQLWARWQVIDLSSNASLAVKESRLTRPVKERTTEAGVGALSEAGADLSREIAATIRAALASK